MKVFRNKKNLNRNRSRYYEYLKSDEWAKIRNDIIAVRGGKCEYCGRRGEQVHHLTYKNLFFEEPDDLVFLCSKCHKKEHGIKTKKKHKYRKKQRRKMSKASRSKGKRGEAIARTMLTDRDWIVLANTADGSEVEDIITSSPEGHVYSVEVKNTKQIDVTAVRKQAIGNAQKKKLPWMIMCKIAFSSSWLVWLQGEHPKCWKEKINVDL